LESLPISFRTGVSSRDRGSTAIIFSRPILDALGLGTGGALMDNRRIQIVVINDNNLGSGRATRREQARNGNCRQHSRQVFHDGATVSRHAQYLQIDYGFVSETISLLLPACIKMHT
jgi:hypothetical protein